MTIKDIETDSQGEAIGCFNQRFEKISARDIRKICTSLGLRGTKNARKDQRIDIIRGFYKNKKAMSHLTSRDRTSEGRVTHSTTRKEAQCTYRLMNILFSEEFAEGFATIGNSANRRQLDSGRAANEQDFWEEVQASFQEPNEIYGTLYFQDDEVYPFDPEEIDPSKIVPHDWRKLRQMWKSVNAAYKAALTKFTTSGTHENDFLSFCSGRHDVYYLRLWLNVKPNLTDMVVADLPDDCQMSSDQNCNETKARTSGHKRKRNPVSDVADAIRDLVGDEMRSEVAKKRIMFFDHEEERKRDDAKRKRINEMRRAQSHEENQKTKKFVRWQAVTENIKSIKKDLKSNDADSDDKHDLHNDLENLLKMKKELEKELGMN